MHTAPFLAHIAEDGREQALLAHLQGTAAQCAAFSAPFGAEQQGQLAGLAHDLGKYSAAFQHRLHGGPKVDHSAAGALLCQQRQQPLAAFAVMGHHSGLPDFGSQGTAAGSTFLARMERAARGEIPDFSAWEREITLPALPPSQPDPPFRMMFFTRMLYSCLVDADYLDTEAFMLGAEREHTADTVETLWDRLQTYLSDWFPPKNPLNESRCAILNRCIRQGETQRRGLFTLTVPTGGGKTVASLAFALAHAKAHGLRRVVYVVPYTSIIEQTADVFRRILGAENVLEHHSNVLYDSENETDKDNIRMAQATENWDMPVIVTTAVQFFESLYANRSSQCRKLHNLARSVIGFDEAQMLPLPYLRPCVAAIAQLVEKYGVSAVLCTATQPALAPIFREFLPQTVPVELCPPALYPAEVFRRVTFRQVGKLHWAELAAQLSQSEQVLCIVNSRKAAQTVFSHLPRDGAFHLSTLMYPAHRRAVLREIRARLKAGLPCRVVSTSLIEAGVDVDFPAVWRETAGLDAILQAAGRCNREGKRPAAESIVTVFQGEDAPPALFQTAIQAGESVLERCADPAAPEAVEAYFTELFDLNGKQAQDKCAILPLIEKELLPFRTVADKFHLIDADTRTVYIPLGEGAALVERLQSGERRRSLFRALGQYGVNIYAQHFAALERAGDLALFEDGSAILRNPALYADATGLSLEADSGKAEFI